MDDDRRQLQLRLAKAEQALSEQIATSERLEHEHELLKRKIGSVAHAINNPLTVMQLRLDLILEEYPLEQALDRQLDIVRDSANRIARNVRILQQIAHPTPTLMRFSLGELLERAISSAQAALNSEICYISSQDSLDIYIHGDVSGLAVAIEQILALSLEDGAARVSLSSSGAYAQLLCVAERASWLGAALGASSTLDFGAFDAGPTRSAGIALSFVADTASRHGGSFAVTHAESGVSLALSLPLDRS